MLIYLASTLNPSSLTLTLKAKFQNRVISTSSNIKLPRTTRATATVVGTQLKKRQSKEISNKTSNPLIFHVRCLLVTVTSQFSRAVFESQRQSLLEASRKKKIQSPKIPLSLAKKEGDLQPLQRTGLGTKGESIYKTVA